MSTKTKTKWRLSELPTPLEVADLVKASILTKEEAREILISHETEEDRDVKGLHAEIKFLRELVEKLSNNRRTEIIKQIEVIEKPYRRYEWYQPYLYYCSSSGVQGINYPTNAVGSGIANPTNSLSAQNAAFTSIQTF